jgi:pimeloyl-CoA synthetase
MPMQTMYRVRDHWGSFEFVKVEVDKVTDNTVMIKGKRALMRSEGTRYFASFDEAKKYAKRVIRRQLAQSQNAVTVAEERLREIASVTDDSITVSHSRW